MFGFGGGVTFDPAKEIPDLSGKVVLVTGGNSGLGAETIKRIAPHKPAEIWLAARTRATAESTIATVKDLVPDANIILLDLDLGSFPSIVAAVETFTAQSKRLDYLFLNAGIAFSPPGVSESGYEIQFGTNHMGHALLTKLLLPTLQSTAAAGPDTDVRVVAVASRGHNFARAGIDFDTLTSDAVAKSTLVRYGQSKLANILYTRSLAARYPALTWVSVHPGTVATPVIRGIASSYPMFGRVVEIFAHFAFDTVEVGALNLLWAAFAKSDTLVNGEYYDPVGKPGYKTSFAKDEKLEARLWEWTDEELAKKGWPGWP